MNFEKQRLATTRRNFHLFWRWHSRLKGWNGPEMILRRFPQPLAVDKAVEGSVPNIESRAAIYNNGNRLLRNTLLEGLAHAIRRDDVPAARRYRGRLQRTAEPLAADIPFKVPLTKLLLTTGLWVQAANIKRGETRQQLLDLIDCIVPLLTS